MSDKNNPVVSDIKLHVVWHTTKNLPLLTPTIKQRLRQILRQDCTQKGIQIMSGGKITVNFVHMIVICPPRTAPSEMVRQFKGRSSRLLRQEFSELLDYNSDSSLWDSGYFCKSFGDVSPEMLEDYIDNKSRSASASGFHP